MQKSALSILIIICLFLCSACQREAEDFALAENDGSSNAYAEFLKLHPEGERALIAQARLDSLTTISGGCDLDENAGQIANTEYQLQVKSLIESDQIVELLGYLTQVLNESPNEAEAYRVPFQEGLEYIGKVIPDHMEKTEPIKDNWLSYIQSIDSLTNVFSNARLDLPDYSYERTLVNETNLRVKANVVSELRNYLDEENSNNEFARIAQSFLHENSSMQQMQRNTQRLMVKLTAYKSLHDAIAPGILDETIGFLTDVENVPMDVCAKERYWNYVSELADKQLENEGLEEVELVWGDSRVKDAMETTIQSEKHEILKEMSQLAMNKVNQIAQDTTSIN